MHKPKTEAQIEPIVVSPKEAMRILDCGHSWLYECIARGELEAVKDGRRTKILMESIKRRAASLPRIKRVGA
jgi:excisionase family DNA binding protein